MLKRTIKKEVDKALENYPVVLITGARQIGKSTLVYEYVKESDYDYVSLDNIDQRKIALSDPKYFIQQFHKPLIIDEVQYAPVLFEIIEEIVNKKRLEEGQANGMFILTGSQAFHLMNNVTQSLAGRVSVIQMQPLSLDEILEIESEPFIPTIERIQKYKDRPAIEVKKLFEYVVKGGYPELYKEENKNIDDYYENYINTYIDRDVSELINIKDKMKFHDFLQYLAAITSQQVNASDIGRKIGVSYQTINHWLSILEATGIIYFIQPYNDFSIVKRIVKSPKVYFADTGVAAYLARLNNPETLMVSHFSGGFNETFIMNEIRKSFLNNKLPFHAYYYRDTNQHEIDLILLYEGQLSLVEIKQGVSFQLSDVKSFQQLESSMYPIKNQLIVCNTLDNYPLSKDVMVVSLKCI